MDQPFDDMTKSRYRRYFEKRGMRAISQYEVFSRSRATDLVVECTAQDLIQLQDTSFAHFRQINALEFKGHHDPLTAIDLNLIMMRVWGIGAVDLAKQEIEADQSGEAPLLHYARGC